MDIKRLLKVTLYKESYKRVFSRAETTPTILFPTNALGIWPIPWGPLPLVCQNQCKKKS